MESLKEKTAKGLFWGGMNNGMQQLLGLVFGIILGRLLSPSDYGLIAMITIFSLIATALQNSGFSTALVNEKEPKDSDYNSVFWFNILMGGSIYLILFFSAPFIADYYHEPRPRRLISIRTCEPNNWLRRVSQQRLSQVAWLPSWPGRGSRIGVSPRRQTSLS